MKINRLLEIVTLLLNKKTVTAKELAERFGTSVRTIYRDIDVLSASGIPVYTTQGYGGGISLMDGYWINRTLLSDGEQNNILMALQSLQATQYPDVDQVLEKLGGIFHAQASEWVTVDFSPWGSNPNANNKLYEIKAAILQSRVIEIDYINAENIRGQRRVEPMQLWYKSQAWYLMAYCRKREQYRTFRFSRIRSVKVLDESFDRNAPRDEAPPVPDDGEQKPWIHCQLLFTKEALYRLYDEYNEELIHDNGDGTYLVSLDFPEDEWVYSYLMGFGPHVEVLGPEHLRSEICRRVGLVAQKYAQSTGTLEG